MSTQGEIFFFFYLFMLVSFKCLWLQFHKNRLFTLYVWLRWLWNIFNKSLGSFTINSSLLFYLCRNVHWRDSLDVIKHQKIQIQMILRNGYYLAILLKKPGNSNHEWQTERVHSWRSASASAKGGHVKLHAKQSFVWPPLDLVCRTF